MTMEESPGKFSLARECEEVFAIILHREPSRLQAKNKSTLTRPTDMNTTTKSNHAGKEGQTSFPTFIARPTAARLGLGLITAALILAAPCAKAETSISRADNKFILAAAQGGMTEVKLGDLAAQQGVSDEVKAFGQMMVKDHTAINSDLKTLAAQKGVTLPENLDAKHQGMVDKLAALKGVEFDEAYISSMIKDHKMDAKEFKAESAETKDADIKAFVDKSLPIVNAHLEHITALKK